MREITIDSFSVDLIKQVFVSTEGYDDFVKSNRIIANKKTIKDVTLLMCDTPSRNKNVYQKDAVQKALNFFVNAERNTNRSFLGELDHPDCNIKDPKTGEIINYDLDRFFKVDHSNVAIMVYNLRIEGNKVIGDVTFTGAKGDIAWRYIEDGMNPAFSVRMMTPPEGIKEEIVNGVKCQVRGGDNMKLICFDFVTVPGFKEAYVYDPDTYKAEMESLKHNLSSESFDIPSYNFLFSSENLNSNMVATLESGNCKEFILQDKYSIEKKGDTFSILEKNNSISIESISFLYK